MAFFESIGGFALALLGASLAAGLCAVGAAKGTGIAGEAGLGLLSDDPTKFWKVLVLQLLPGLTGIFGLVVWYCAGSRIWLFTGVIPELSTQTGFSYLMACLPMALGGLITAVAQGRVAAAAINLLARKPADWVKGLVLCVVVGCFAVLSLAVSLVMLAQIG